MRTKRFLSAILVLTIIVGLTPTAFAAGTGAIQLGAGGIIQGSKVYFGKYAQGGVNYDVPWVVRNTENGSAFLLSEYLLGDSPYTTTQYHSSALKTKIDAIYSGFDSREQSAVIEQTSLSDTAVTSAHLYPLSRVEAESIGWGSALLIAKYINNPATGYGWWWLRTSTYGQGAYCVGVQGNCYFENYKDLYNGVRPAFNLDNTSVLFTSAATSGKLSGSVGAAALKAVSPTTPVEWKLTLKDNGSGSGRESFDVATESVSATTAGGSVSVNYSGAKVGTNEYLSAMIVSGDDVLYYGRLKSLTTTDDASGTQSITIPAGLTAGATYTLKLFNEQYNGDKKTDYSSGFENVTLTVSAAATSAPPPFTRDITSLLKLGTKALAGAMSAAGTYATGQIDDITMEVWIYPESATAANDLLFVNGDGGSTGYCIYVSGAKVSILLGGIGWVHSSTGTTYNPSSRDVLTPGQWTHIAITRDAAHSVGLYGWEIYVNGQPQATTYEYAGGWGTPNPMRSNISSVQIVRTAANAQGLLVSEARIWEKALTQEEIYANMSGTVAVNADKLVGYWRLDDGTGTTVSDVQTNKAAVNLSFTDATNAWVPSTAAATNEDMAVTGQLAGGIVGGSVTYAAAAQPAHGTVTVNANGAYTYTPTANYNGSDSFTFTASANGLTSAARTVNITVASVNDAPTVAKNTGATVISGSADNIVSKTNLEVTDVESAATAITYTLTATPTNGTLANNGTPLAANGTFTQADINDGKITCTHAGGGAGTDSFYFTASDGDGGTVTGSFAIIIEDATCTISFGTHPATSTSVIYGSITDSLSAAANVSPSGTAALNWYACDAGGTISGNSLGTGNTFAIPTDLATGTHYYLCRATAAGAAGVNSNVATVIVSAAPVTQYTITVTASPTHGGTVSGGGTFDESASRTVTATANTNYHFVRWTENGAQVNANASYTFALTASRSLVAVFEADGPVVQHTITVNGGTADKTTAAQGETVTITAGAPATGKRFKEWTGASGLTFTEGSAATATAKFTMPASAVMVIATYEDIPVVLTGGSATFTVGADTQDAVFTIGMGSGIGIANYDRTVVGSTTLNDSQVTAVEGSIKLSFKRAYLNTLGVGTHTATVYLKGTGYAGASVTIQLTVNPTSTPTDPTITDPVQAKTVTVVVGSAVTLSVNARNATGYQWYIDRGDGKGFVAIQNATGASYTTAAVTMANDGYRYYCRVYNSAFFTDSPIFTLNVIPQPDIPATGDNSMPGLWLGVMMLAGAGLAASVVLGRGKRHSN